MPKGFTVLELLIVLVILGILVIIAVPLLYEAKLSAQATAALTTLRNMNSAQAAYFTRNGNKYFGTLSELAAAGFLDARFAPGTVTFDGYVFTAEVDVSRFTFWARPQADSNPVFYVNDNNTLHYENGEPVSGD